MYDLVVQASNGTFPTEHLEDLTWFMGNKFNGNNKSITLRTSRSNVIKTDIDHFRSFHRSLFVPPLQRFLEREGGERD